MRTTCVLLVCALTQSAIAAEVPLTLTDSPRNVAPQPLLTYDPQTGNANLKGGCLEDLTLASASGILLRPEFPEEGPFVEYEPGRLFLRNGFVDPACFPGTWEDGFELGAILPTGLTGGFMVEDLSFGAYYLSWDPKVCDIIGGSTPCYHGAVPDYGNPLLFVVPEPSSVFLAGLGMVLLLSVRER